jgi:hypothetical protein
MNHIIPVINYYESDQLKLYYIAFFVPVPSLEKGGGQLADCILDLALRQWQKRRRLLTECLFGDCFMGAMAYADDIVYVHQPRPAMRKLLAICNAYADEYPVYFNAVKSKCFTFL